MKKLIFEIPGKIFGIADKEVKICVSKLSIDTEFLELKSLLYNLVIGVRLWKENMNAGFPGRKSNPRTFKCLGNLSFMSSWLANAEYPGRKLYWVYREHARPWPVILSCVIYS